ncbi:MAG: threonylcarbamoyl-AMP synthase [Gammaproteobacteria bacterium RIFCSPLOWO2_12_47_11]|jgi:tRNA threonylcarbamoyl adenosine modification protein (Sua5/YciO/YrdC/YwlC family)|nr:MAG: threonylcarbamoyl-AMP synthase [Gammaproteobacteria bacterium RIFCSPLOWO2_12_47_11]OGT87430.1 MAG: threonylcarbamoyl-AMP synthase [Gammaproteobacteria bacterium RIFCSPLOWO2_12_FULL_47_76]
MTQYFRIHPGNPQKRLISQAADILREGGVVVYPTDSCYAIGCRIGDKDALERIRRIRHLDEGHNLTLMCEDLSEIATYAKVNNPVFRLMKAYMPGPYTFLLLATRDVPKRLQHPKRKTIGVRVPDNPVTQAMLIEMHEPILSTSLILPGEDLPLTDPEEINNKLGKQVDLILDGGICGIESTTVVDLAGEQPVIVRQGKGNIHAV